MKFFTKFLISFMGNDFQSFYRTLSLLNLLTRMFLSLPNVCLKSVSDSFCSEEKIMVWISFFIFFVIEI